MTQTHVIAWIYLYLDNITTKKVQIYLRVLVIKICWGNVKNQIEYMALKNPVTHSILQGDILPLFYPHSMLTNINICVAYPAHEGIKGD